MMHLTIEHKAPDCQGAPEARWTSYFEPAIYCFPCGARRVIRREPLRSNLIDFIEGVQLDPYPKREPESESINAGARWWCRVHHDQPTRANGKGCTQCEHEAER